MNKYLIILLAIFFFSGSVFAEEQRDFVGHIKSLPPNVRQLVEKYTWHPGCPVNPDQLAYVELSYWGFDDKVHQGVLIVNQMVAEDVVDIFAQLFQQKYPIQKMIPIYNYYGDDKKSMADNNTSAFNCRTMTNRPGKLSMHSYGVAIDINPLQNPSVQGKSILPPAGKMYLNRNQSYKGMIFRDDVVYNTFISHGWRWGGDWRSRKDYQHFEK